ncbi:MAG: hypothetical protein GX610_07565 [Rhodococcus sp.]|nr:hypothetical protein [Rhodococcus sp. (in: high G+C Gram-positive bacteria)]
MIGTPLPHHFPQCAHWYLPTHCARNPPNQVGTDSSRRIPSANHRHGSGSLSTHITQPAAHIQNGTIAVTEGSAESPDLVITTGPAIKALMAGEITPTDALEQGSVAVTGDAALLENFARTFSIP